MTNAAARFSEMPGSLREKSRTVRLDGDIPALVVHPDWERPAPCVLWMHGRTVNKELDPGRYLRWLRAGLGACAIDLPGHGERFDAQRQHPRATPGVIEQALPEVDRVVAALGAGEFSGLFDPERLAIGGMSLGGMVTLRRLCDPNPFVCAAIESTTGDLARLYGGRDFPEGRWMVQHEQDTIARIDALPRIDRMTPIPLLALHSESDRALPFPIQRDFIEALRRHYTEIGADPGMIELVTWPETGAVDEHAGFGRFSNDAKNIQTAFLARHLLGD